MKARPIPEPRIYPTKDAAARLGFIKKDGLPNCRAFMSWARDNGFAPVHGKKHHLWWDLKAIERNLDNRSDLNSQSEKVNYSAVIAERIKQLGDDQSALSRH